MRANFDVQLWSWFLVINSYSTLQVCMKFACIVTDSIFLQSYWVSDNVLHNRIWFPSFQAPIRSSQYFQAKFPKFRPINFDGHKNNDLRTSFSEKEELRVPQKTSIFEKIVAWLSSFTHSFRRTVSFIIAQSMKFGASLLEQTSQKH